MKIIIATLLLFSVFVQDSEELGTGGLPRAKPKPTTKGEVCSITPKASL